MYLITLACHHEVVHVAIHSRPLASLLELFEHGPHPPMSRPRTLVELRHQHRLVFHPRHHPEWCAIPLLLSDSSRLLLDSTHLLLSPRCIRCHCAQEPSNQKPHPFVVFFIKRVQGRSAPFVRSQSGRLEKFLADFLTFRHHVVLVVEPCSRKHVSHGVVLPGDVPYLRI